MRESPAVPIINQLLAEGASLKAYDPVANSEARKVFRDSQIHLCAGLEEAIQETQAIVLVTRWDEFKRVSGTGGSDGPAAGFYRWTANVG